MKNALALILCGVTLLGLGACTKAPHSASAPTASAVINEGTFVAASGEAIRAVYRTNETVTLTFANGETKVLQQAVSGSGIRFVQGESEWVEHQGEGTYSVNDKPVFVGKLRKD